MCRAPAGNIMRGGAPRQFKKVSTRPQRVKSRGVRFLVLEGMNDLERWGALVTAWSVAECH